MDIQQKARFYSAMGEPVRLRMIEYMLSQKGCRCICELSKLVKREQSVVFRHIQILKQAGIIETKKQGCFLLCCIKDKARIRRYLEA
jgi:ArsR family transcriptional regulator